ncbi:MAG: GGDEF domain-containing protein [Actinomycetota bacterium]
MSTAWSLHGLSELIADLGDPEAGFDIDGALTQTAETLDVEIAGVCLDGRIESHLGFGVGDRPDDLLVRVAAGDELRADLGALGEVHVTRASIEGFDGTLVLGRTVEAFTADEIALVRAIGRVLGMAMRVRSALESERSVRNDLERRVADNHLLLAKLRERQGLLDRLFNIQRSISHRLPTNQVLDAVTEGARDLLGVGQSSIRLLDPATKASLVLVSHQGVPADIVEQYRTVQIGERIPRAVIEEGRLVVTYEATDAAIMSAAISVEGDVVGCLSVGDTRHKRFSAAEQEALLALAQHASLALQDARATDAMRRSLERERHRAEHDSLTGLPNRTTLCAELDTRLRGDGAPTSVLFVDLDRFKLANDTLGHAFGDEVLTVVADRLRTAVRDTDIVGRLSGDEFVVICEGITDVGAIEFAERLQAVITRPIASGDVNHVITASVGIAAALPGQNADEVLANADLAMYRAKQGGRARIDVFDDHLRAQVAERLSIGQELRRALANGEFVVHLQPLVALPARRVTSFEALVRWDHPTRGLLAPGAFLPSAEELGLVADIDRIVLQHVVGLLGRHPSARPIAVNLSVRSFADPQLVDWLADLLRFHGVTPDRLRIEVTETVLMDQTGRAAMQIQSLRQLGIGVMIDDFGTGYSSLSYLQAFDVDGVKIDRSFIARLGHDARAEAIITAVFNMAEALGLTVIAEGIEHDHQVDQMVAIRDRSGGVELHGQGYLFGRPADGEIRLQGFVEVHDLPVSG